MIGFTVACDDIERAAETFAAITGGNVQVNGERATVRFSDVEIAITSLSTAGVESPGVCAVQLSTDSPTNISGATVNGVVVDIVQPGEDRGPVGDVELDHVALAVGDLQAANQAWAGLTGVEPHEMGLHPISNGAWHATRVLLGGRMIEILSPTPGVESPMADRIAKRGDNVIAVAMPAHDLDAKLAYLQSQGIAVLDQPPHKMVHPRYTGGVLVQLTPRVEH